MGSQQELSVDFPASPFELNTGDVFLLCSDGLTSLVGDDELKKVLTSNSPDAACTRLVALANEKGGKDNVTVQVVKVVSVD